MAKTTRDYVRMAVRAAEERKAQDVAALDLRGRSPVTDFFVLASGTSDTHVRAVADAVREALEAAGQKPYSFEGYEDGTWVLIDYVDFVVHVFHLEKRLYFGLEELWSDAKRVTFRAAPKVAAPKAPKAPGKRGATAKPSSRAAAKTTGRPAAGKKKG